MGSTAVLRLSNPVVMNVVLSVLVCDVGNLIMCSALLVGLLERSVSMKAARVAEISSVPVDVMLTQCSISAIDLIAAVFSVPPRKPAKQYGDFL
jgi:hypothetical protein